MDYSFETDGLGLERCNTLVAQIWADLAFDSDAHAALKRDGLALGGLRLTGPMPFVLTQHGSGSFSVSTKSAANRDALLDLFRLAILPRLRSAAA
jgi:hypothetical protein